MRPLGLVLVVALAALLQPAAADDAPRPAWDPALSKAIDAEIDAALQERKLMAAAPATDAEFVRRAYLDILGRIPTPDEATAYLDDKASDKHHRLIDALLAHPEMPLHWRDVLNFWLSGRNTGFGHPEFRAYLAGSVQANKPWDVLVREMLVPDLDDPKQQPAAYFLASRMIGPKDQQLDAVTTAVSSIFFGVRLECAKCHDHPLVKRWKQDHYYGLASFFNRTDSVQYKSKPGLSEKADGQVTFVNTERETKTASLMFLDGKVFAEPPLSKTAAENYLVQPQSKGVAVPKFSRRQTLAGYALTADNPFFKRAIANRVWKQLLGRGLVEPVDQLHDANKASHPKLLDLLADDLAGHQFDLGRLIAGILHTEAYRRGSLWTANDQPPDDSYAVALLRPLSAEQWSLSLLVAAGQMDSVRVNLERGRKDAAPPALRAELDKETKSILEKLDSDAARFQTTTAQALFLTYNPAAQKLLTPVDGLTARMGKLTDNAAAARLAYLATLSRRPTDAEVESAVKYLETNKQPRATLCRDLVWALLNSAEFRFNH